MSHLGSAITVSALIGQLHRLKTSQKWKVCVCVFGLRRKVFKQGLNRQPHNMSGLILRMNMFRKRSKETCFAAGLGKGLGQSYFQGGPRGCWWS